MEAVQSGQKDESLVYLCSGSLEASVDLQFVEDARGEGHSVILDMSGVDYINSCGFGALVEESMGFQDLGKTLSLMKLRAPIRDTINVLGAEQLLTFLD